jgi:hypothetical protein
VTTDLLPCPNGRECLAVPAAELEALAPDPDSEVALSRLAEYRVESDENYQAILRILSCGSGESTFAHAKRLLIWAVTQETDDLLAVINLLDEACQRPSLAEESAGS